MQRISPIIAVLLLFGCPRPVPTPVEPRPAPPPPVNIPPGCNASLAGDWVHQDDPTFRYHFEDDGADVTVWVYRAFPPKADAGMPEVIDGGAPAFAAAVIHLRRGPDGFNGETETQHLLASGRECRATFATRVVACAPDSLTLSSATSTPVGEGCQTPPSPQPAAQLEHRLARTDAGAL